ncbi:MAG: regulatory protein RecX [Bacteroidota bacterium]|jgi:regulatory protein
MEKKYLSKEQALTKLQQFCAYQDRCHKEVRGKLLDLGVYGSDLEDIMVALIQDKFLDEERFARSFARGKFRMKGWGRNRITRELKMRQVSDYCIRKALSEIDAVEYLDMLNELLEKKMALLGKGLSPFARRNKLVQYALQQGFEAELVWEVLGDMEEGE